MLRCEVVCSTPHLNRDVNCNLIFIYFCSIHAYVLHTYYLYNRYFIVQDFIRNKNINSNTNIKVMISLDIRYNNYSCIIARHCRTTNGFDLFPLVLFTQIPFSCDIISIRISLINKKKKCKMLK